MVLITLPTFSAPVIKFEYNRYTVNEPIIKGDMNILRIPVIRLGDTSGTSEVRVSTKSGSARAGRDFNGYSRGLYWKEGSETDFQQDIRKFCILYQS